MERKHEERTFHPLPLTLYLPSAVALSFTANPATGEKCVTTIRREECNRRQDGRNTSLYPLYSDPKLLFEDGIQLADINQQLVTWLIWFICLALFNQTNKTNQQTK